MCTLTEMIQNCPRTKKKKSSLFDHTSCSFTHKGTFLSEIIQSHQMWTYMVFPVTIDNPFISPNFPLFQVLWRSSWYGWQPVPDSYGQRSNMSPDSGWIFPLNLLSKELLYIWAPWSTVLHCTALPAGQSVELQSANQWNDWNSITSKNARAHERFSCRCLCVCAFTQPARRQLLWQHRDFSDQNASLFRVRQQFTQSSALTVWGVPVFTLSTGAIKDKTRWFNCLSGTCCNLALLSGLNVGHGQPIF